jgi:UDP-N-acetylglucosamine 1-carboxyvinyltransferase
LDKIVIRGGRPLTGAVRVSGAKNAVLPILSACILTSKPCRIKNVPRLVDVETMVAVLRTLGIQDASSADGEIDLDAGRITHFEDPYDLVRRMRASVLVLGPLLARMGQARVSLPGGCAIGTRPVNLHLKGLEALGAAIRLEDGYIIASAKRLRGAHIALDIPTVTGTENLMMAASLAEGETVITNAACEPEVEDLGFFLNKMGARIKGAGTDTITICGVTSLNGTSHEVIPDRVEAATYLIAGVITGGDLVLENCPHNLMAAVLSKLQDAGAMVSVEENHVRIQGTSPINSVDIVTAAYPGFPTDVQAQFMALMTQADGSSRISETVFENRFMHVQELRRMGADVKIEGHTATVKGVEKLYGAPVMATDLRASASLVIAGLAAEGETTVNRIYHLDRGYEMLTEKLATLGANIERVH